MLEYPDALEEEFQGLLKNDSNIFKWLTADALHGIWFCNINDPKDFWISNSFWKTLGYATPSNIDIFERWSAAFVSFSKEADRGVETNFEKLLNFRNIQDELVLLCGSGKVIFNANGTASRLLIKFKKEDIEKEELLNEIKFHKKLNEIFEETNQVARVGGWECDLITNKIIWTRVTRDIHEVEPDFKPNLENVLHFFKEGWSRDTLNQIFNDAIEKGIQFDAELKLLTAKGNEIWVRSFGKPEIKNGKCIRILGAFQDIDAKKKNELEKERFENIFNSSSIGVVLIDKDNRMVMANPASLSIFGFTDDDREHLMHNLTYKDFIHPDHLAEAYENRHKLVTGKISSYTMISRFYKSNGEIIWCRVNTSIIPAREESDELVISQIEDITASKKLEQKSLENSERFIGAFEYSPNGMALVNLEGKWLMVNEALSQMLGYTKEEFLKLTFQDMTHKHDLDADLRMLRELLENKRTTYSIEKRYIHKDGSTVYGLLNVSLIRDQDGNPQYFISQINNITKRVQAQQDLQKSLNELQSFLRATTQVSIIQANLDGTIAKFNKGAENLLGYKAEEVVGIHGVHIIHDDREVVERGKELSKTYNTKIEGFDVFTFNPKQGKFDAHEWTYIRKDGKRFPVHLVVTSIVNHHGEITGFVGIATDISRLKKMESSLMAAKLKAEAASKSKSEFLANMSHEIRTPLNGVIGFTDLLIKTDLNETQRKYMQLVNTSAHSLLGLINDILDFSKIEAGKLELSEEKTDILELCGQTIDIVKHQAHAKGLEILLNIAPEVKRYIYADPVRLRQVLTNLLGNAVKFTEKGEIELKVENQVCGDCEDEMLYNFTIRDTGIGIAPHNLQKIFNAFDQEDASTTRKYGGTGLGITISNRLLELMNSSLKVESELNKGSTFSFEIRFKSESALPFQHQSMAVVKNVLVVDDNANNLIILRDMLAGNNINSKLVSNGIEAIEILEEERDTFDLAIIDYNMPYLNGVELISHIRSKLKFDHEKLPVMLLHSSVEDEKLIQACRELDVRFNVTKPILSGQLFSLINVIGKPNEVEKKEEVILYAEEFNAPYKILVAEDNPVNKILATTIIQKILPNAAILLADDGLEAVEMYKKNDFDLIFMDIQMPNMSGFEATEKIRQLENNKSHLPIIALTARVLKGEKEQCLKLGMDNYVTKPIIFETIREMIELYLVKPKM